MPRSLLSGRSVGSSHRLSEVERTTPFLMFRPTGLTLRAAPPKERDHLFDGAATPPLPRSIQSCPAGQRQNTQETAPSKTKDLSAQFLERGVLTWLPTPRWAITKCVYFTGLQAWVNL